jgi:hypothetical protein
MKNILILVATACLLLVAGCSTISSPTHIAAQGSSLQMNEPAALSGGNYSFNASISEISVDSSATGGRTINIFITAKNTGANLVQLSWFSKLTGADGTSFGGVNVSHGGSGAHTTILSPGLSDTPRDYVVVPSDKDYAALSQGATLDVTFYGQQTDTETPVTYHASWAIDPAYFR